MNSLKPFATLIVLVVVGGFLYLKITEKEAVLPDEAADMTFDAPVIEMGGPGATGSPASQSNNTSGDYSTAGSAAPAWTPPPAAEAPAAVASGTNSTAPNYGSAPVYNASETVAANAVPLGPSVTPVAVVPNPFDAPAAPIASGLPVTPLAAGPTRVATAPQPIAPVGTPYTPPQPANATAPVGPQPAAVNVIPESEREVIEGRVYETPPEDPAAAIAPSAGTSNIGAPPVSRTPDPSVAPAATQPASVASASPSVAPAANSIADTFAHVEALLLRDELSKALLLMTPLYHDPSLTPEEDQQVQTLLSQLAGSVIYSRQHRLGSPHIVLPGETLESIAQSYNVPPALLAKINGIANPKALQQGTELKVMHGPFHAMIDLKRNEMALVVDGRYAGRFPIRAGIDNTNAEGTWTVTGKQANPVYQSMGQTVQGGDPSNPLGAKMLSLQSATGPPSQPLGIHGSQLGGETDPRGYLRLSSKDVNDVFDILSVGSKVTVRR